MPMAGPAVQATPMSLDESVFLIYRWDEDGEMSFARRLFIKHEAGTACTNEMVRQQVEDEIFDFKPAKYRAVPADRIVDFEVKAEAVLS